MEAPLSLKELNNLLKSTIEIKFNYPLWVVAEINSITEHRSGHCYLELIQKSDTHDTIVAQLRATIWSTRYRIISGYFEAITNKKLSKGIKILIKVSVDFHELYGLSLNIREIDPNYTLGDLAKRRKDIIKKLETEGVINMNKRLPLPCVIQKIAVISSSVAAGFEDFVKQLSANKHRYTHNISLFEANMQGENTENSIINALENIFDTHEKFDIVVIIRGGGSKSDLSYFDNYNIAFYITQFPLPILTGIGHERDESVTDIVAHTRLKTPTAVADFIIEHNFKFEKIIDNKYNRLMERSKSIIKTQELYIISLCINIIKTKDTLSHKIEECNKQYYHLKNIVANKLNSEKNKIGNLEKSFKSKASALFKRKDYELENEKQRLINHINNYISNTNTKIIHMEQKIKLLHPSSVLKKGYSILMLNDKIIRKYSDVKEGDVIESILDKGKIKSTVIKNNALS
jgi:exodeoxyribonuclease VII large subunit